MNVLYIDCPMGAAGDMLAAALLELLPDPEAFVSRLNTLGIPGVHIGAARQTCHGVAGTNLFVRCEEATARAGHTHGGHTHTHTHRTLGEIEHLVCAHLTLPDRVRQQVLSVYRLLAGAEGQVHGATPETVHFHEVGRTDAVADIAAVCLLMDTLAPDQVIVSPIHVGSGHVRCAHGLLPVPAPATARILQGVPIYGGEVEGELCTPTGAALLRHFACRFGPMPPMEISRTGFGLGKKDFGRASYVRAVLGQCP